MSRGEAKGPRSRMRDYRAKLRAAGLRPLQIWVPDTRSQNFAEEARRQSLSVRDLESEREALDFIDALTENTVE